MKHTATYLLVIFLMVPVFVLALAGLTTAGEIHDAISAGDMSKVEAILAADPGQISARNDALGTPLHVAVSDSQVDIARFLISRGADVNAGDSDNSRPLHWAAFERKRELVEILLEAGADLEIVEDYGNSPLTYAIYGGDTGIVNLLLDRGADPHHANTQGQIPLQYAVAIGRLEIVKILVAHGADVNHVDAYGLTPLFSAKARGWDEIAAYLKEVGATRDFEIPKAKVEMLAPAFHVVTVPLSNRTNCGVQSGEDGLLLVDTGYQSSASRILEALAEISGSKHTDDPGVEYIITTHLHGDHFSAHSYVDSTATVIDFTNLDQMVTDGILTRAEMGLKGRTGEPYGFIAEGKPKFMSGKDLSFAPHYSMNFNGEEILLIPAAGTHSETDLLIWFKQSGVVCTGSLLLSESFPGVSAGKIEPYLDILCTMIDVFPDDTMFTAGHGRTVDMAGLKNYTVMVMSSAEAIHEEVLKGKSVDEMLAEDILGPWSEYGECPFMPYQTPRVWISAVARTYIIE
ncbi:MAG: ankyrin repeat domain-containing protein [Candidatus Eisenbacteria bacterium]